MEVSRNLFTIVIGIGLLVSGCDEEILLAKKAKARHPNWEYFAICTANLDGSGFTEVIKDPRRSLTHARVSKDHKWITFSRFNKMGPYGIAGHEAGYEETEVLMARIDGSDMQVLVPAKKGVASCNSYWTPDGKSIIYGSNDNPEKIGQTYIMDIATRKKTRVPTPAGLATGDPFTNGELVVFPARTPNIKGGYVIHIMNIDGSNARALSKVTQAQSQGEFDPKISPDKTKVAFMRYGKKGNRGDIYIIVTDIATGKESDISIKGNANWDAMPEWSSDGKRLVFWHVNRKDKLASGLYTIKPDGTDRKRIPTPFGYQFTITSFWPGTGSGDDAKLIFSVRRFSPQIRRKLEVLQKRKGS